MADVTTAASTGYTPADPAYRRVTVALFLAGVATFASIYTTQSLLPLLARDFAIDAAITSDCAPLAATVSDLFAAVPDKSAIHTIRDATRGGVGTVLHEIAAESHVGIELSAPAIPVAPEVRGVCGLLGLEPLYLACEGRLVLFAPQAIAQKLVETLRALPDSRQAAIIGRVTPDFSGRVVLRTEIGTKTLLPEPSGELLPRIC